MCVMRKAIMVLVLAGGCATTTPGPQVAQAGAMSFAPEPDDCTALQEKRNGLAVAALSALGVSAGTGIGTVAEIGHAGTHDTKVGLGITAAVAGAAALAMGIPAWSYQRKLGRCR